MTPPVAAPASAPVEPRLYMPGYAGCKLLLCVGGAILCCAGLWQLWPPLRLLCFGGRAQAIATRIVGIKPGVADIIIDAKSGAQASTELHQGGAVFWNEFEFHTAAGQAVELRDNIGSRLKPLYPLIDSEGLPTTRLVSYDRGRPKVAVFPEEVSTWLVPIVLTLTGLAAALISGVLLYWAGKPIELPDIPAPPRTSQS